MRKETSSHIHHLLLVCLPCADFTLHVQTFTEQSSCLVFKNNSMICMYIWVKARSYFKSRQLHIHVSDQIWIKAFMLAFKSRIRQYSYGFNQLWCTCWFYPASYDNKNGENHIKEIYLSCLCIQTVPLSSRPPTEFIQNTPDSTPTPSRQGVSMYSQGSTRPATRATNITETLDDNLITVTLRAHEGHEAKKQYTIQPEQMVRIITAYPSNR